MSIKREMQNELEKLGLTEKEYVYLEEIRTKDGVHLYKIKYNDELYVLKYFSKNEYTREIENYSILNELNIPTIRCFKHTDKSLLLEDISKSKKYRLGIESDLSDIQIAGSLAKWYTELHDKGSEYISKNNHNFYRETDVITKENIELIRNKSHTVDNKVWDLILNNLEMILEKIAGLEETLTYNDFYYTNLVVSKDKQEAIMFDYNFLGIGYRYSDIRNVCSSLSKKASKIFIEEYGEINEFERIVDNGVSILINLIYAFKRPKFPSWAEESLESTYNGRLEKAIRGILQAR